MAQPTDIQIKRKLKKQFTIDARKKIMNIFSTKFIIFS